MHTPEFANRLARVTLCILCVSGSFSGYLLTPAQAQQSFTGKCLLEVDNQKYIDGQCPITLDADGSFTVGVSDTDPLPYFAYVSVTGKDEAEGSWNADKASSRAHVHLGTLTRKGACWQNETAKVCAWK